MEPGHYLTSSYYEHWLTAAATLAVEHGVVTGSEPEARAIMTDVAAFSGVQMEPGTLYRALSWLERRGWVRPLATAGRRRRYEIAAAWPGPAGRARRPRPAARGHRG